MASIRWKENKVVSIRLKNGVSILAQMLRTPFMLFFSRYSATDDWQTTDLSNNDILFVKAVTRQFLQRSEIVEQREIAPLKEPAIPRFWIRRNPSMYSATVWPGTSDEVNFIMIGEGGGTLVQRDIYDSKFNLGTVVRELSAADYESVCDYELDDVAIYPALNERLLLCYKLGKNVDPDKELIFGRPMKAEYKDYFRIISGKFEIGEFGY